MSKIAVFNVVSLDGFIADAHGDMQWAHKSDPEQDAWTAENARGGSTLLFGRKTYEMMASFWPTPMAAQHMPVVAERMNSQPKVVFSRTLETPTWNNTRVAKGDLATNVAELTKSTDLITVLGSASIVSQLADADLIDELTVLVSPVILGKGLSMFAGLPHRLALKRTKSRAFENGNVALTYERARE